MSFKSTTSTAMKPNNPLVFIIITMRNTVRCKAARQGETEAFQERRGDVPEAYRRPKIVVSGHEDQQRWMAETLGPQQKIGHMFSENGNVFGMQISVDEEKTVADDH